MAAILAALSALAISVAPSKLIKTGKHAILSGDFARGISALEEAERAAPDPALMLDIANAYDEWGGHCASAIETFRRFFEACASCALLDKARNDHVLVLNRCASDISFETHPSGAIVRIESDEWSRVTPFTTRLIPGTYRYEIHGFGHEPKRGELIVEPATPRTVSEILAKSPGLSDDDLRIDMTPRPKPPVTQATPRPAVEAVAERRPLSTGAILSIGAGLAAGGAGAVFVRQAIHDVDAGSPASRDYALAYAGFGVCLAGLALGVVLGSIQ